MADQASDQERTSEDVELGGDPILTVLVAGSGALASLLADPDNGLAGRIRQKTDGAIEVALEVEEPAGTLLEHLPRLPQRAASHRVTILSFDGDLPDGWPDSLEEGRAAMDEGVRALKAVGTRVLGIGVSTFDPHHTTDGAPDQTTIAHELNLLLLELSVAEGISIVDADRIVAELGAARHVRGFLDYDDTVLERLVDETARVLEDYGFFEQRPLLPQVGVRNR